MAVLWRTAEMTIITAPMASAHRVIMALRAE